MKRTAAAVEVRTLNGLHRFKHQRYKDSLGQHSYFLDSLDSQGILEFLCFYSNRLSYRDLSDLLVRLNGKRLIVSVNYNGRWWGKARL